MVDRIKLFYPLCGIKKKSALLASNGFQHALFKLFCEEACRERIPFEMKPFKSYSETENWLL